MFRHYFDNLQVLNSHTFISHLATHAHAFKHLCRVRTSTNRTWLAGTIMLTVSRLTNTSKTVAFNYTLEAFTFGRSYYINETGIL